MSTVLTPGLVYDAGTHEGGWPNTETWRLAFVAWLNAHGVNELDTYRVEFHLIDAPLIRVFQYAKNELGRSYVDPATRDIATLPPLDVLITTPAPRPEDYA